MRNWLIMCVLLGLVGCEDDVQPGNGPMGSGGAATTDDMGAEDATPIPDAGPPVDAFVEPPPPPEPAFVELTIDPRRSLYTRDDHPVVSAIVYDRIGREIEGATVQWDVQPEGRAEIRPDQTLDFLQQGQGAVRGCANPDICGRVSFFIDDGSPTLELTSPMAGAVLIGEREIQVEGRTDTDGVVQVFINDAPVEIAEDGTFTDTLRAEFGLNRIEVIADDGVRRPATRIVREVVWAPQLLEPEENGLSLTNAAKLRIGQDVLDGEGPRREDDNTVVISDIAGAVEVLLSQAELTRFLPNLVIENSDRVQLEVVRVEVGEPQITLQFTDTGLDIFLRLDGFALHVEGALPVGGEDIDLTGSVQVTAAAFAQADLVIAENGEPGLVIDNVGVAIERLDGQMNDSSAQAFLDTIGGLLRLLLDRFATETVDSLVREEIPDFISFGLGSVFEPLAELTLNTEADGVFPALMLSGGANLSGFQATARRQLVLALDLELSLIDAPGLVHPSGGVPVEGMDREPAWPAGIGVAVAMRLAAVNAALDALWRQGSLRVDLSAEVPEGLGITGARIDASLPPLIVPSQPGAPTLFELQLGELQMYLDHVESERPDQYSASIRAGVDFAVGATGIRFDISENPDMRFALVSAGGERAFFPAEALAGIVEALVWPNLEEAIETQTSLLVDEVVLPGTFFANFAPNIESISLNPIYPDRPVVRNGWIVLGVHPEARVHLTHPVPGQPDGPEVP